MITGYGIVFAPATSINLGGFIEQVDPQSVEASLRSGSEVKSFFNHDPMHVLGTTAAGTMRLTTDKTGVKFEVDAPPTTWADDLLVSISRRDIRGSSFAFFVEQDEWRTEGKIQIRTLKKIHVIEMGPCTNAAYPAATSAVRSMLKARGLDADRLLGPAPVDPRLTALGRGNTPTAARRAELDALGARIAASDRRADLNRLLRACPRPGPVYRPVAADIADLERRRRALATRAATDPAMAYRTAQSTARQQRAAAERTRYGLPAGSFIGRDGFWRSPE